MNTRSMFLSIFVTLILLLASFGCEANGGDTGSDTSVAGDTGSPPDDTGSPPDDSGNKPDSPDPADTPDPDDTTTPPTCDDGLVELERDGVTECVSADFAEAVEHLDGLELMQTEPNSGSVTITLEFHHVSDFDVAMIQCEGFSKFFIQGLAGAVKTACVDETLALSMCENDTTFCGSGTLTGQITYSKSETPEVVIRVDYCGEGWCNNFVYESTTTDE